METKGTTGEETISYWFDLPIDVTEFEEKLGVGAESGDFLGFKLMVTEEQLNLKNIKKSAWLTFTEFLHEVNHTLMNDFVSMPNDEINRYMKMEKLLENKISRRFKVRRLEINDFGYLMEHLYGRDGICCFRTVR